MEDFLFKDIEENKACIISALFCAQNVIASAHYTNVLELLDAHKVPVPSSRTRPEDGNIGLNSEGVGRGFLFASSQYTREQQRDDIRASPVFSILFDEPSTQYYKLLEIPHRKTGIVVADLITSALLELGLQHNRCISIGTDGTNSMIGLSKGAVQYILKEFPNAFGIHFICHDEALAIKEV
jgi:hypothetical protein